MSAACFHASAPVLLSAAAPELQESALEAINQMYSKKKWIRKKCIIKIENSNIWDIQSETKYK